MKQTSIKIKYSIIFSVIALFIVLLAVMNSRLINKIESELISFSDNFNPAISAVLNADRDLYQARVAELKALSSAPGSEQANNYQKDYEDNAQQAYDRMLSYKNDMKAFPQIISQLTEFDTAFNNWKDASEKVFDKLASGDLNGAKLISNTESATTFSALRDFYDIAGESADKVSKSQSETALAEVHQQEFILLIISILVIVSSIGIGYYGPKMMSDSLEELKQNIIELDSGDGDLSKRIKSTRRDEIGDVSRALDSFIDKLSGLISAIKTQSSHLKSEVGGLTVGAQTIKSTSLQQSQSVEHISSALSEMEATISEVSENAAMTSNEVEQVSKLTEKGTVITTKAVDEITKLSKSVSDAAEVILKLSENSSNIASVLNVIRGIAEQTNLLALNAAIEAARAGEQGRGFAVVADEVRTLASRTQQSTEDIQAMIKTLQEGVQGAVDSINQGSEVTESAVSLSHQTLDALQQIAKASKIVSDVANKTADATERQRDVSEQVTEYLVTLSHDTQENINVADNNEKAARGTSQLAASLSESVSSFKLQ